MEIRRPTASDVDTLVKLWVALAESQREHGSHLTTDDNRGPIRDSLSQRLVVGGVRVAVEDDTILGFVSFYPESGVFEQDCERGIIENLYVRPEYRRSGVGSRLLDAGETALTDGGADTIALESMADNDDAKAFYYRHGYTPHRVEFERPVQRETDTRADN